MSELPVVNIHKVLQALRALEEHPAVKAYIALVESLKRNKSD